MALRPFLILVGVIFTAIAAMHVWRLLSGWPVVVGNTAIPMWVSWLGLLVTAILALLAFRHASRQR